jgi:hypothetical protein
MSELPERFRVPRTVEEIKRLVAYRKDQPWWEYLVFAGVLAQRKEALEPKWRDYEIGYVRPTGESVDDDKQAWGFIAASMHEATIYTQNMERALSPNAQLPAFGPPGTPGDPVLIEHLAGRVISCYDDLLDRAARIRGTKCPDRFRRIFELAALFTDKPLHQFRDFIDDVVDKVERIPETIKKAEGKQATLLLQLVVSLDPQTQKEFNREAKKIGGRRWRI